MRIEVASGHEHLATRQRRRAVIAARGGERRRGRVRAGPHELARRRPRRVVRRVQQEARADDRDADGREQQHLPGYLPPPHWAVSVTPATGTDWPENQVTPSWTRSNCT